jgi:DNA (cytosine-5)-methyltransferase 1
MGFNAKWGVLGAADVGANHQRDRIWIVGKATYSASHGPQEQANKCIMESQGRGELQFSQSRNTNEMGNTNNNGQITSKVSKSIIERSNSSQTRKKQTSEFERSSEQYAELAYSNSPYGERNQCAKRSEQKRAFYGESSWWETEPNVGRVADGVASRVDQLKAIGNGQVPLCAATAWRILSNELL